MLVGLILFNVDLMVVGHVGSMCLGLVLVDSGIMAMIRSEMKGFFDGLFYCQVLPSIGI